jgi:hypothetical protein
VKWFSFIRRFVDSVEQIRYASKAIQEGIANQAALMNDKLGEIVGSLDNEQRILNDKLGEIVGSLDNEQRTLNDKLGEIVGSLDNEQRILNDKLSEFIGNSADHQEASNEKLSELLSGLEIERRMLDGKLSKLISNSASQQRMLADKLSELLGHYVDEQRDWNLARSRSSSPDVRLAAEAAERIPIIYLCYSDTDHDRTYTENLLGYVEAAGIKCCTVRLCNSGERPELEACLHENTTAVIGYNSQLDHSRLPDGSFLEAAAARGIPIIQWILDHPSTRWREFSNSTSRNSRFLFNSRYSEQYFQQYCLPGALTATMGGVGPNWRSRVGELSWESFQLRPINCLIPINLTRLSGGPEEVQKQIAALDSVLARAVIEAAERARFDLNEPLETHLHDALGDHGRTASNEVFNECFNLVDAAVQAHRRLRILEIARDYPVFIQTDESALNYIQGGKAQWATGVSMPVTAARMTSCRAVLSVSALNDMIHDRTMNALNAGCVAIVEDSLAHRTAFEDMNDALFFRYDDDSLSRCFSVVCDQALQSYQIAKTGFGLRSNPRLNFGEFENVLRLAR